MKAVNKIENKNKSYYDIKKFHDLRLDFERPKLEISGNSFKKKRLALCEVINSQLYINRRVIYCRVLKYFNPIMLHR